MTDQPRDIVFVDTETLGLHPEAPIWEFAAIRRTHSDPVDEDRAHFTIAHDPHPWIEDFARDAPAFYDDYRSRFVATEALDPQTAAIMIHIATRGAELVMCNPVFDEPRLTRLLAAHNLTPAWHYHPHDIASLTLGWLAARSQLPAPPWKSDALSRAAGINPEAYERHTAFGDVLWTRAQWDLIICNIDPEGPAS